MLHDNDRAYEYIHSKSGLPRVTDFIGIIDVQDGKIAAAFGYDNHQGLSCFMHIAAQPGGLRRKFLAKAFEIPYVQWGYNVTMGLIIGSNLPSRLVAARLGYAEMLVIPGAHPSGALHLMGMYRENCPWIKTRAAKVAKDTPREQWRHPGPECPEHVGERLNGE